MMREKKSYWILTFSTTPAAMSMEKFCMEQNIPGRLIPVPRQITAGCGLAWRMTVEEYERYRLTLKEHTLMIEQSVLLEL